MQYLNVNMFTKQLEHVYNGIITGKGKNEENDESESERVHVVSFCENYIRIVVCRLPLWCAFDLWLFLHDLSSLMII